MSRHSGSARLSPYGTNALHSLCSTNCVPLAQTAVTGLKGPVVLVRRTPPSKTNERLTTVAKAYQVSELDDVSIFLIGQYLTNGIVTTCL